MLKDQLDQNQLSARKQLSGHVRTYQETQSAQQNQIESPAKKKRGRKLGVKIQKKVKKQELKSEIQEEEKKNEIDKVLKIDPIFKGVPSNQKQKNLT